MSHKFAKPHQRWHVLLRFVGLLWLAGLPDVAHAASPAKVLVFGDSLAAGFGLPPEAAFPVQLEAKLHAENVPVQVVNGGNSGDTTAAGLARLDWALADKPTLVILELGANDMLRGIDPVNVRANLQAMIDKIKASGAKLLLAGMQSAPNWGKEYQRDFNRIYPELAQADNVTLYPFFLEGVAMDPKLNQPDGKHPNENGVEVLVDRIAPLVAKMLGGAS
ncbi:MAG TPA: arylesterase [Stellaceae bacterium]|jgi:acyl-CoA thioesterase-1|nr:arylesterase [Stellaceae bacterium]